MRSQPISNQPLTSGARLLKAAAAHSTDKKVSDTWEEISLSPGSSGSHHPLAPSQSSNVQTQCTLRHITDIAQLTSAVPALAEADPSVQIAFDLDDTLITERGGESTLTQPNTLKVLTSLQEKHPCFGLTARPFSTFGATWLDTRSCGIDFSKSAPWQEPVPVSHSNAGYFAGVFYTGENNVKGDFLATILQQNDKLQHLVFVDDQPRNFVAMTTQARVLADRVKVTCIWYTGSASPHPLAASFWQQLVHAVNSDDTASLQRQDTAIREARLQIPPFNCPDSTRLSKHLRDSLGSQTGPITLRLARFFYAVARDGTYDTASMGYFARQIYRTITQSG